MNEVGAVGVWGGVAAANGAFGTCGAADGDGTPAGRAGLPASCLRLASHSSRNEDPELLGPGDPVGPSRDGLGLFTVSRLNISCSILARG